MDRKNLEEANKLIKEIDELRKKVENLKIK